MAPCATMSPAKTIRRDIQVRVLANRIRRGTTLSRHLLTQIDALDLPRLETVLSEAVAYGELMRVMNLLRDAGYQKVALVALESRSSP